MINETHPDFPKYKKEFERIWEQKEAEINKINTSKNRERDGENNIVNKKYYKQITELQKKYNHIFTE